MTPAAAPTDDAIFRELMRIRETDPSTADLLQFRSMVTAAQYRRLYRLTRRLVPAGSEVLDWGCGNGHFSYALKRMGHRVSGFAFEDFALRRHLGSDYHFTLGEPGEPVGLPYPENRFDAVFSVGVLEHVREFEGDEAGSLREIRRVLRPGGHFVCYHFPNQHSLVERVNGSTGRHTHLYRYTEADVRRLSAESGMELVQLRRYAALPRNVFGHLPAPLSGWGSLARAYDAADAVLGAVMSPVCQNYLFVARKPR